MILKKLYELSIGELRTEFRRAGLDGDFSVGYAVVRLTVYFVQNSLDPYNFQFDTEEFATNVKQEVHDDDGKDKTAESVASTVPVDGSVEAGKKAYESDRVKDDTYDGMVLSPVMSMKKELTTDDAKDAGDMEISHGMVDKKEPASCVVKDDASDFFNISAYWVYDVLSPKSSAVCPTIFALAIINASSTFLPLPKSSVLADLSSFEWMDEPLECRPKLWPPDHLVRHNSMRDTVMS